MGTPALHASSGPLEITAFAGAGPLRDKLEKELGLLDVDWAEPRHPVWIELNYGPSRKGEAEGRYLEASRMDVDHDGGRFFASCESGAWCESTPGLGQWNLHVPRELDEWVHTDIERMLSLVLTAEWRNLGWVPVHAGAVTDSRCCALLCAESGGGKSSLTAAFLHRGWNTLGDDKLLLRLERRRPTVRALAWTFNMHPNTARWFPEVGSVDHLPRYSSWTEKRKVHIADYWPGQVEKSAVPTHLLRVRRSEKAGIRFEAMPPARVIEALLRQTVIPGDAAAGRAILGVVAQTAARLRGVNLSVGPDVYNDPAALDGLLESLQTEQ